jgi:nidogen (entactin)
MTTFCFLQLFLILLFSPALATSCQTGSSMCHTSANCQQYSEGFCCICQNGWFGNGETCLSNGFPQRIRGKVNGVINSIAIEDQDLHCYVVTDDGRTYTAISK